MEGIEASVSCWFCKGHVSDLLIRTHKKGLALCNICLSIC